MGFIKFLFHFLNNAFQDIVITHQIRFIKMIKSGERKKYIDQKPHNFKIRPTLNSNVQMHIQNKIEV